MSNYGVMVSWKVGDHYEVCADNQEDAVSLAISAARAEHTNFDQLTSDARITDVWEDKSDN